MSDLKTGGFKELERCELKYHIPQELIPEIQNFIRPFCTEDPYSKKSPTGFYRVRSLYMDTDDLLFFQWKNQKKADRFNMRIRTYGEEKNPNKFFLELKRKRSEVVNKYRATLEGDVGEWLEETIVEEGSDKNQKLFSDKKIVYGSRPVLMTSYLRNAWFGNEEDYARVTFDKELRHEVAREYRWDSIGEYPTDFENYFNEGCNVVLELKAQIGMIPLWMKKIVEQFELKKTSFSKYGSAVKESKKREGKFWV